MQPHHSTQTLNFVHPQGSRLNIEWLLSLLSYLFAGAASSGGGELPRWSGRSGRFEEGYSAGEVFAGTTDGELRAWKIGSLFPHRMFKPVRRHEGFEVTCVATSRNGMMLASADSSGRVCLQSATAGGPSSSTGTSSHGESGSGGGRVQFGRL